MQEKQEKPVGQSRWLRRIGWMLALWAGGVAALWLVAQLIRTIMHAAGLR